MRPHIWLIAALALVAGAQTNNLTSEEERRLLLAPKALPAQSPASAAELRKLFTDPPSEFRSMPLWVWNDLHEWPRLREMLGQMKQQGMGGVFIHPRPGLMTEYLGADWFKLWKQSAAEGKRLGLLVNIYDENSYPAGFAGGHVPSRAPDTASQFVQAEVDLPPSGVGRRGSNVASFAAQTSADGQIVSVRRVSRSRDVQSGERVISFRLRRASGNPWTGEFPYVDLTNPQTTSAFLETTYEAYKREIGSEFGKTVRWAFTDEPLIATGGAYDSARLALPLSYNTLAEFQQRNRYDLADHLPSLYWDVGEFRKVRFDYWQTLHDLWKENFMRPMFLWCDRNNLQFTGHWMEHEWPFPWITPADANLYAYEHVPGIDMLEGSKLRVDGKDPHMLFTIKQVASVSHQLGRRAFCEAYGVAGWDSTFEHYKRFGDWLMVHGVNFMNQHLAFTTVRGARKRDHPQSFTDHSAWWPYYKLHGDHLGRFSMLSSRSESANRLLVLQQTTSGFLFARRGAATPELDRMRANNAEMNQFLADHQVDFDLGDEYMIEWFGSAASGKFKIARAAYDLLVIPPDLTNLRSQTLPHLEKWLAGGGRIIALSPPPEYVDGRPSGKPAQLRARFSTQWALVSSNREMLEAVRSILPPRIRLEPQPPSSVGFSERRLTGGDRILLFANSGLAPARTRLSIEAGSLEIWDTVSGQVQPAPFTRAGNTIRYDLDLAPAASLVMVARAAEGGPAPPRTPRFDPPIPAEAWRASADTPNVMVLDYCDLKVGQETFAGINTWQANWTLWQRHGFERPAWDNAVQYKTRIFDKNRFPPDSGFEAVYRFEAPAEALKGLHLAVEAPELYRVAVNGQPVDFKASERWQDPHIRAALIEKHARAGENVVSITGRPFDVKMELENIYLRGNFGVEPAARGFRLTGPKTLMLGSWARQGMPFYADAVTYETKVTTPAGNQLLRVELGEWQGSLAVVLVDGKEAARLGWPPYRVDVPVTQGPHRLALRIVSTPRNLYGPYHHPDKPRMRAWPAAWALFPDRQPSGSAYDVLDYGLMTAPAVSFGGL
ncbi:MAG: hypothetical protein ACKV22_24005 [Bryobacteraceae bacterium]